MVRVDKINKIIPHKVSANVSTPLQIQFYLAGYFACIAKRSRTHKYRYFKKHFTAPCGQSLTPQFFTMTNVAVISGYQATVIWCQTFCVVSVLGGWLIWLHLLDCILKDRLKNNQQDFAKSEVNLKRFKVNWNLFLQFTYRREQCGEVDKMINCIVKFQNILFFTWLRYLFFLL